MAVERYDMYRCHCKRARALDILTGALTGVRGARPARGRPRRCLFLIIRLN